MEKEISNERYKKLVLLHSNDMHGDFLAEHVDDKLVGGVAMLSGYVTKTREEEPNTIYAIAGDMFRGSVIDSEFRGISTIEIMNMISPDVVTIGNHETDYGLAHLLFLEKCARFPIINANFHIKTNNARLFKPYTIIEKDGMKILFIGILTEQVLSQTKNDGIIGTFVNMEEAAAEVSRICNAYNAVDIDFTVLLTHIGFEEDKQLAAMLDPALGVDVIIGGHSHTFIDEPAVVNDILIVQAGTGTDLIGRFDITVDTEENCVAEYKWQAVPINKETCPVDRELEELLKTFKNKTDDKYNRVVTRFVKELTHPARNRETELGDLFADILRDCLSLDMFFLGSGSIRNTRLGPIVMFKDLCECFPYDDPVWMLTVTGEQVMRMLKRFLRAGAFNGEHTEFYQISEGLYVKVRTSTGEIVEAKLDGEDIDPGRKYTVGLQNFHYKNLKDFFDLTPEEVEAVKKPRMVATSVREILDEYLSAHQLLNQEVEDRLVLLP
ncbi:MAG: bifunctional metallophosphatase/5'-nucleotidase [Clostridia bacterium]|nr:bifunctional metallophosphatase/5'-nucleotidase [Clostridia bacterium]